MSYKFNPFTGNFDEVLSLSGVAAALRTVVSEAAAVEENAVQYFNIGLFDIDSGAILSASIDITGITATLKRSRDGAAFADTGITQPTFSKANGSVYCAYQFLAAEWQTGDMYQMIVAGITATISESTGYVPTAIWSNVVVETADIDANVEHVVSVVDDLHTDLADIHTDLADIHTDVADLDTDLADLHTDINDLHSDIADLDSDISAVASVVSDMHDTDIPDLHTDLGTMQTSLEGGTNAVNRAIGKLQMAVTTESMNQAAGSYDLFTGTTQAVVLEKLLVKMPAEAAGGALTSISIQTDDATPGVIIGADLGAVANLTSEAELSWTGCMLINVGTKIQLTIAGGAHGTDYAATIVAQSRAVVNGGYLA